MFEGVCLVARGSVFCVRFHRDWEVPRRLRGSG
jgi:hypothetical protein